MTSTDLLIATGSYGSAGSLALWAAPETGPWQQISSADVDSPSFVGWHPRLPVVYAISELENGLVTAWRVGDDGSLTAAGSVASGGANPCWVAADAAGRELYIANYGTADGQSSFAVVPLGADGGFAGAPNAVPASGSGPVADRQAAPHTHQTVPTPVGTVLACDLGADAVIEYSVADGAISELERLLMPAGSGPRHAVLTADGYTAFVSGELDASVTTLRRDSSSGWHIGERVQPCTSSHRVADEVPIGELYPSHIALAGADRWLLVANRGVGTVAVLDVADDLKIVAERPVAAWPRHFAVLEDGDSRGSGDRSAQVLVAGQHGNVVERLDLDLVSGELSAANTVAQIPTASCVAPKPRP